MVLVVYWVTFCDSILLFVINIEMLPGKLKVVQVKVTTDDLKMYM